MKRNFVTQETKEGDRYDLILLCTLPKHNAYWYPCACRVTIEVLQIKEMNLHKGTVKLLIKPIELKFWEHDDEKNEEESFNVDMLEVNTYNVNSQDEFYLRKSNDGGFLCNCEVYEDNSTNQKIVKLINHEIYEKHQRVFSVTEIEDKKKMIEREIEELETQTSTKRARLMELSRDIISKYDDDKQLVKGVGSWAKYCFDSKNL